MRLTLSSFGRTDALEPFTKILRTTFKYLREDERRRRGDRVSYQWKVLGEQSNQLRSVTDLTKKIVLKSFLLSPRGGAGHALLVVEKKFSGREQMKEEEFDSPDVGDHVHCTRVEHTCHIISQRRFRVKTLLQFISTEATPNNRWSHLLHIAGLTTFR